MIPQPTIVGICLGIIFIIIYVIICLFAKQIASAGDAQGDYFCTCDDKFLNRAKAIQRIKIKAVSPLELIEEIEK